jgi:catechol 2,3-dioxygenase-like lactoylglutathione lyase family enzyme
MSQPSVIDHVDLRVRDLAASRRFYVAVLAPLGFRLLYEAHGRVAFGTLDADDFGISQHEQPTTHLHLAFSAPSAAAVDDFHRAALAAGARSNGEPGYRPQYHAGYYGAFVFDPDGNNIEAVFHDAARRSSREGTPASRGT